MAVYRVNKNRGYTVMANYHLRDKTLSLKAVGLLSKMLSFNDGLQLTGCHVAHFVFSPFLAAPPSSARGRLFQLSGNKKRGFASCSELENETNPLSFSDIQMISRMVWMMPSSSPTIRASPPIRAPMMMLSAKIPTVPDMP